MKKNMMITAGVAVAAAVGLALGGAALANADGSTPTPSATGGSASPGGNGGDSGTGTGGMGNGNSGPSKPMRSDEQLLTGDPAATVTAAAKAKEPGATIQRVETDSEGVYEAHMVRADGTAIVVQVDANFAVTNVQTGGPGRGGVGAPGSGRQGQAPSSSATSSS
jgi:hypothetical protein